MPAVSTKLIDTASDFDLGPLSWVHGEIGHAFARGLDFLSAFRGAPSDPASLKQAKAQIHQAAGAIQMVGLDAVVVYTDEIERQLVRLNELAPAEIEPACRLVDRACRRLGIFLDELIGGVAPQPLKLFPEYEAMQRARGVQAASPSDLFFPDLNPRGPALATLPPIPADKLASHLVKERRLYQRGLLAFLHGDDAGARMMREAVGGIEHAGEGQGGRVFWWTVGAFFDALIQRGLDPGFGAKQLAARLDLQIRRVVEGSAKVSNRLRREVLYFVAVSTPVAPTVQAVQRAFGLTGLVPSAEVLNADLVRLQPMLRQAREQLGAAKDMWLKVASGRADRMPKLRETLTAVRRNAVDIGNAALSKLVKSLEARLESVPPSGDVAEPFAMEYATGILLAESAVENFSSLSAKFGKQVEAMLARLDAAQASKPVPPATGRLIDDIFRRAQERMLFSQVAREIQANLRRIEQVLDAFFRDHGKRAELATLAKDSLQIRGALKMLGQDDAERLLGLCQVQIESYANVATPIDNEDLELLAEALSGLGFYIEAFEQQRPDRQRLIAPLLAKRLGEAAVVQEDVPEESLEDAVEDLPHALPALVAEAQRIPADVAVPATPKSTLDDSADDAKVLDDSELVAQVEAALAELEGGGTSAISAEVAAIAESGDVPAAPAPAISAETQRLLATDAQEFDAELMEIYLEEAAEVLDTVATNRTELERNPGDREALRSARRQFHTLKGSGRMVGLMQLGEIAFSVEAIHNRLLEEERAVTPAVLALIAVAEANFRGWVGALHNTGTVTPDTTELQSAIRKVEAELPSEHAIAAAEAETPEPALESAANVIELPELGRAPVATDAPSIAAIDRADESSEDDAEIIEFAPVGAIPAVEMPAAVPPLPVMANEVANEVGAAEVVRIGELTLSPDLYTVLVDEAQAHLATLELELSLLQFDPAQLPSPKMVRASHTLCGIHRTSGLPLIASTAKALEQCLLALQQGTGPRPEGALPTLAGAVRGLRSFVESVKVRRSFDAVDAANADQLQQELEILRHAASAEPAALDAETQAEQEAEALIEPAIASAPLSELVPVSPDVSGDPIAEETKQAPLEFVVSDAVPTAATAPEAQMPREEETAPAMESAHREDESAKIEMPVFAQPPSATAPARIAPPEPALPKVPLDPLADIRDDVDVQVLPVFLEEAAELYPKASEQVRAWRRTPVEAACTRQLQRTLHTFKGSARMAGAMRLGELAHLMESRLVVNETPVTGSTELFEALDGDLDRIGLVLDALRQGRTNVDLVWTVEAGETAAATEPAPPASEKLRAVTALPRVERGVVVPLSTPAGAPRALGEAVDVEGGARAMLRVRADIIDRLVNEAGEVAIARARIEGELRALKSNLLELTGSVIRLRTQVREIEIQAESQIQSRLSQVGESEEGFDPLEFDRYTRFQELARGLTEGVNDVSTVQQSLLRNLDVADAALVAQARLGRDLQQQLFSIRTVPFGSLSERLYRILRGTAKELDKRANLEIRGAQTELDRSVLEKLVGPLEHLLRNALDHGIETRGMRLKAGKSETGEITLTVRQIANEIAIELTDDGAGLDLDRVRAKAIAQGRFAPDALPTDGQLMECIFEPGFSTAAKITQVSGRGVGMDVVRSEIVALGGRVEVSTRSGHGTTFLLYLPLTLAVAQAVLVRAGGRMWAFPAPMVEQVQHVKPDVLVNLYVQRQVEWQGLIYPFHYLPRLLGDSHQIPESARTNPVMLLRSGQSLAAVHVDALIGNQEVVVKNIGPQLARVSGIAGATVLGTGEIVLIINPVQLAQRSEVPVFDPDAERVAPEVPKMAVSQAERPLVMIVDDSLTVRRITSRLLTREGFDVLTARDGIDALELLENERPDVILLDIEMPRMDGFEFAKTIRGDPGRARIPIVMITSRTAEKHRNRAKELGVDLYLGKPFQEDELLMHLREMLALTP